MEFDEHVAALRRDVEALAAAAGSAGLGAAVPTCPQWTVRDLVRHVGGVHRWARSHVAERRAEMWSADLDEVVGSWPADADLLGWLREGGAGLARTLEEADPDLVCATFLPAPSPLAMWARRQAHETAIHRVDAERAAGVASSFPPAFAADGVDELLVGFIARPRLGLRAEPPRTLRIRAADAAGDWRVRIGPDGPVTATGAPGADCEVHGPASDLYLALWSRQDPAGLTVQGDDGVFALFLDRVHI